MVVARFEGDASWNQVLQRCTWLDAPSECTVKRWCRSFAAHAPSWLGLLLLNFFSPSGSAIS